MLVLIACTLPLQLNIHSIDHHRDLVLGGDSSEKAEAELSPVEYALNHAHVTITQANREQQVIVDGIKLPTPYLTDPVHIKPTCMHRMPRLLLDP